jgi:hypothetical protein
MEAEQKEHEQQLALIQVKLDAAEAELKRLVVEYDTVVSSFESTKVLNKKAVVLHKRAKDSEQQTGRKYSTNIASQRRRVNRNLDVLSPAEYLAHHLFGYLANLLYHQLAQNFHHRFHSSLE